VVVFTFIVATLNAFYYLRYTSECYQSQVYKFKNNNSYTTLLVDSSNYLTSNNKTRDGCYFNILLWYG